MRVFTVSAGNRNTHVLHIHMLFKGYSGITDTFLPKILYYKYLYLLNIV